MQSIKRKLSLVLTSCALTFVCALAWGNPFVMAHSRTTDEAQQQDAQQSQDKATTFTGTIQKDGDEYTLHDSSGAVYKLDDQERAKSFAGKTVTVSGQLDQKTKQIHVESIAAPMA